MEGAPALERALPADGPQPLLRQLGRRLAGRLHDDDHGARAARARCHAHRLQRRQHARPGRRVAHHRLPAARRAGDRRARAAGACRGGQAWRNDAGHWLGCLMWAAAARGAECAHSRRGVARRRRLLLASPPAGQACAAQGACMADQPRPCLPTGAHRH